jgi:hypothetical protein
VTELAGLRVIEPPFGDSALAPTGSLVLDRDRRTGAISQPAGRRGGIVFTTPTDGCAHVSVPGYKGRRSEPGYVGYVQINPDGCAISVRARRRCPVQCSCGPLRIECDSPGPSKAGHPPRRANPMSARNARQARKSFARRDFHTIEDSYDLIVSKLPPPAAAGSSGLQTRPPTGRREAARSAHGFGASSSSSVR